MDVLEYGVAGILLLGLGIVWTMWRLDVKAHRKDIDDLRKEKNEIILKQQAQINEFKDARIRHLENRAEVDKVTMDRMQKLIDEE